MENEHIKCTCTGCDNDGDILIENCDGSYWVCQDCYDHIIAVVSDVKSAKGE